MRGENIVCEFRLCVLRGKLLKGGGGKYLKSYVFLLKRPPPPRRRGDCLPVLRATRRSFRPTRKRTSADVEKRLEKKKKILKRIYNLCAKMATRAQWILRVGTTL